MQLLGLHLIGGTTMILRSILFAIFLLTGTVAVRAEITFEITGDVSANPFGAEQFSIISVFNDDIPDSTFTGEFDITHDYNNFNTSITIGSFVQKYDVATATLTDFDATHPSIHPLQKDFINFQVFGTGYDAFFAFSLTQGLLPDTSLANFIQINNADEQLTGRFTFLGDAVVTASNISVRQINAVPEPATWLMMILGFAIAGISLKRRANSMIRYSVK